MRLKVILVVLSTIAIPAVIAHFLEAYLDRRDAAIAREHPVESSNLSLKRESIASNNLHLKQESIASNNLHLKQESIASNNLHLEREEPVSTSKTVIEENHAQDRNSNACIQREEIIEAQQTWGDGIVFIGQTYQDNGDYKIFADELVDNLYAYNEGTVLFKPTKAAEREFRLSKAEAVSYFVKGIVPEDRGFAIQPWSQVRFENAGIIINCDSAFAMGDYFFTDAKTNREVKAEYTFGYKKNQNGELLINLHHSSFPYHQ